MQYYLLVPVLEHNSFYQTFRSKFNVLDGMRLLIPLICAVRAFYVPGVAPIDFRAGFFDFLKIFLVIF